MGPPPSIKENFMSDEFEVFSLDAPASSIPEAEIDASERSGRRMSRDDLAARARARVDGWFATGILGFAKDAELGPVLMANRASLDERIRGRTIAFGDAIATMSIARGDVWADYEFDQT